MSASSPVRVAHLRDLAIVSPLMQGFLEHSDQAVHPDQAADTEDEEDEAEERLRPRSEGKEEDGVVRGRTGAVPQFIWGKTLVSSSEMCGC